MKSIGLVVGVEQDIKENKIAKVQITRSQQLKASVRGREKSCSTNRAIR